VHRGRQVSQEAGRRVTTAIGPAPPPPAPVSSLGALPSLQPYPSLPYPPTHPAHSPCPPRWYRDPLLPVSRTEVTRFPHAVLEVEVGLYEGENPPEWVDELTESSESTNAPATQTFLVSTLLALLGAPGGGPRVSPAHHPVPPPTHPPTV
jgi:hypothetical protein